MLNFFKKPSPVKAPTIYDARVSAIAQSEVDFAVLAESCFLLNLATYQPKEERVVGQHRVERDGMVYAVVPIQEYVVKIPSALVITGKKPEDIFELKVMLKEKKATVTFGPIFVTSTWGEVSRVG